MPRISKKQLYEDERKILCELKNPKITISEIASKLHFSKQKIYRVQKKYHMDGDHEWISKETIGHPPASSADGQGPGIS